VGSYFFQKIGCHGNVPCDIRERRPGRSSTPKTLSFAEKIAKTSPVDPEIICLREIIKDKKEKEKKYLVQTKYIARSAP